MEMNRRIWMRLGVMLEVSDDEVNVLLGDDDAAARDLLRKIVAGGRLRPEGDSYIPAESIEDYNETYGTAHECCEFGFDI